MDTLIVIPNDKLLEIVDTAYHHAGGPEEGRRSPAAGSSGNYRSDQRARTDQPGLCRCADRYDATRASPTSVSAKAKGDDKAVDGSQSRCRAARCWRPPSQGATDVIINVSGDISMFDASDAVDYVREITGDDVNIIFAVPCMTPTGRDYCRNYS